jgi:hypothetical protein
MEAASVTLPVRSNGLWATLRRRRADRRARRLMSDAERFERAASRLEPTVGPDAWQLGHLRRQAEQLRVLAMREQGLLDAAEFQQAA